MNPVRVKTTIVVTSTITTWHKFTTSCPWGRQEASQGTDTLITLAMLIITTLTRLSGGYT